MAPIRALETLTRPSVVRICTDSVYVKDGVTAWMPRWKVDGWLTRANQPVKNVDLWQRLDRAMTPHQVEWHWVKGHAGHPDNERKPETVRLEKEAPSSGNAVEPPLAPDTVESGLFTIEPVEPP